MKFWGEGDKIESITRGLSKGIPGEANPRFFFILDLDDSMFVKTSTPAEWIAQGDYYAKHQCWKVRGETCVTRGLIAFVTRMVQGAWCCCCF